MAGPASQSFVGTRLMDEYRFVVIDGVPVIESFSKLFDIVSRRCGPNVAALFPEPRISRGNGGASARIDWYAQFEGIARSLNQLDASSALAVRRTLESRLAALRPLAFDPECGPLIAAALNVASPESIISVGGDPVLTDWGILPLSALRDEQTRTRHFGVTLGPFIGDFPLPPVSHAEWGVRFAGSNSPASLLRAADEVADETRSSPAPTAVSPPPIRMLRAPSLRVLIVLVPLIGSAIAAIVLSLPSAPRVVPVPAEEASKDDIVCALNPKCAKPVARSTSPEDTRSSGPIQPPLLSVDLYVNFAYDSAELTPDARTTLDRLGTALRDQRLDGFAFMIAGHTDAKGSAEYNLSLSERRAEAVRQYMITQYGIRPERLSAKGYGKSRLLDPTRPEDGVNRRVQVLNMTASGERQ